MFRRGLFPLLLIVFLIFALSGRGRSAAYREGWSQGYYAAQQADGDGRAPAMPPAAGPYDYQGHHGWHFAFFPFLCLLGLVPLVVMGAVGRCFARHAHHKGHAFHHGGPHHWHGPHKNWHGKGKPFWAESDDEPLDDTIRKA